jgi:DNA-binding transcriptional LysR family regulator
MKRLEDIDLNLLLLLHWLLEEQSVTRAAKQVGISQPAASRGLRRLRDVFSDELIIRSGRAYTLSRLANEIRSNLAQAIQYLRIVANSEDEFLAETSTETIAIACNDYLTSICTKAWLEGISPRGPNMRASWRPLDSSVKDALVSGKIDFAILPRAAQADIPNTAAIQDMVIRPLLMDKFVVFGPATHSALQPAKLSLKALASADHILVSPNGEGRGFVDRKLSEQNFSRRIIHRTVSFNHAAELAISTGSLTVIPEKLAEQKLNGIRRALPFEAEPLASDIIWHASRTSDKTHAWVRGQLQKAFNPN